MYNTIMDLKNVIWVFLHENQKPNASVIKSWVLSTLDIRCPTSISNGHVASVRLTLGSFLVVRSYIVMYYTTCSGVGRRRTDDLAL